MKEDILFCYKGFHFFPLLKLPSTMTLKEITSHLQRDRALNLRNCKGGLGWDYKAFYRACPLKDFDVFCCKENGKNYIPGEHELFEYL